MKVMIVSDTHRKHYNLEMALRKEKPLDLLVHLGDAEGEEDYIQAVAECPLEVVAGNCDFFSSLQSEMILKIGKYRVLVTHGHYYCVNAGIDHIKKEAVGRNADVVMFGHTHRPFINYDRDIITMNPGSISFPRQEGKKPSYIIMNIDDKGHADFELRYLI